MNEVATNISWLPAREVVARIARHLGYPIENARLRIVRYVKARRIQMRGRNAGLLVYATGHGPIDWGDESIELCLDDLIEAGLLPGSGRPEGPVERARQPADRAIAYLITGYLVEWEDWTPGMIRGRERGEIKLGEAISEGLPAWGQKSLQAPIEQIPPNDFRSEMVAMKALPVNLLHLPKVVVRVDRKVGVLPPHRLSDYMGPPWCLIEVEWAGLKLLRAPAEVALAAPAVQEAPAAERPQASASAPPPPPESSSPAPATPKTLPNNPEMILSVLGLKGFQQRAIAEAVVEHEIDLPEDIKPAHLRDTVNKLQKAKAQARGSKPPKPVKWDACNDFVKALRAWRANQRSLDG